MSKHVYMFWYDRHVPRLNMYYDYQTHIYTVYGPMWTLTDTVEDELAATSLVLVHIKY
jgi:hypothetical protein